MGRRERERVRAGRRKGMMEPYYERAVRAHAYDLHT